MYKISFVMGMRIDYGEGRTILSCMGMKDPNRKRKVISNCREIFPAIFLTIKFYKTVSQVTQLLDYIEYRSYNTLVRSSNVSILLALTLAHHNDGNPYGWHMSCERFLQRRVEIQMDTNLDQRSKWNLIGYLKTKVEGECDGTFT